MSDLRTDLALLIATAQDSRAKLPNSEDFTAADRIIAEYYVISRTPLPRSERPVCPACGIWVCAECGYQRRNANRFVPQECGKCHTENPGSFLDIRHSSQYVYEDHLEALKEYTATGHIRNSVQQ